MKLLLFAMAKKNSNPRPPMKYILPILYILLLTLPLQSYAAEETSDPVYDSVEERRLEEKLKNRPDVAAPNIVTPLTRENELKILEKAVDKKLSEIDSRLLELKQKSAELDEKRAALEELITKASSAEKKRIESLAKIYEKMTAVRAAAAITGIDNKLASDLLRAMKPKSAAAVLDVLPRSKASELTVKVSGTQ